MLQNLWYYVLHPCTQNSSVGGHITWIATKMAQNDCSSHVLTLKVAGDFSSLYYTLGVYF